MTDRWHCEECGISFSGNDGEPCPNCDNGDLTTEEQYLAEQEKPASNVVKFPGLFYGELNSAEMLRNIAKENPAKVFVVVWPADGSMPTYHSNTRDVPTIIYRLQTFMHKLFNGDFGG